MYKGISANNIRSFIIYLGPVLLVSLAYMDPTNFGTAIEGVLHSIMILFG